jgi:hypothetical protein
MIYSYVSFSAEPFTASQKYDWMFAFIRLLSHAPEEVRKGEGERGKEKERKREGK